MKANQDSKSIFVEYFLLVTIAKAKIKEPYRNDFIFLGVVNTLSLRNCDRDYSKTSMSGKVRPSLAEISRKPELRRSKVISIWLTRF